MSSSEAVERLGKEVRSVLISSAGKGGRRPAEVAKDFEEMTAEPLAFRRLGFASLAALFGELERRGVCEVDADGLVYPVPTEETRHTLRLVQEQRNAKRGRSQPRHASRPPVHAHATPRPPPQLPQRPGLSSRGRSVPREETQSRAPAGQGLFGRAQGGLAGRLGSRKQTPADLARLYGFSDLAGVPKAQHSGPPPPPPARGAFGDLPAHRNFPPPSLPSGDLRNKLRKAAPSTPVRDTPAGKASPQKPAASSFVPGSSISLGRDGDTDKGLFADFGSAAMTGAARPGLSAAAIRTANFHLKSAARDRTPPSEPRRPQWTTPPAQAKPSPAPVSAPQPSPRVEEDDWSQAWLNKPGGEGERKSAEVCLVQYEELGRIFLIRTSGLAKLRAVEAELSSARMLPIPRSFLKPGLLVVAHVTEPALGWHRAEVLEVGEESVTLQCLDYGTSVSVPPKQLFHLPAKLASTPRLAREFRCWGWDAAALEVADEDRLEDFVLSFCDVESLEGVALVGELAEDAAAGRPAAVDLHREVRGTGERLGLADEALRLRLVRPKATTHVDRLADRLRRTDIN